MKYDELNAEQWIDYSGEPRACYPKNEVDAAIAEGYDIELWQTKDKKLFAKRTK